MMIPDEDLKTPIQLETRIATRLLHITTALELCECEQKEYILNEVKLISILVSRAIFPKWDASIKEAAKHMYGANEDTFPVEHR